MIHLIRSFLSDQHAELDEKALLVTFGLINFGILGYTSLFFRMAFEQTVVDLSMSMASAISLT